MATIEQIAARAGCSPATVSRAFNHTARVAPATYAAIVRAARELGDGFRDQGVAQAGGAGRPRGSIRLSDTVEIIVFRRAGLEPPVRSSQGVVVSSLADLAPDFLSAARHRLSADYYRSIIDGATSALFPEGLKVVQQLRSTLADSAFMARLQALSPRGVLLLGESRPEVQSFADTCGLPLVLIDILGVNGHPAVIADNAGGIRSVLQHLIGLGHRDIGFAGHSANPCYKERRVSYMGQLVESGLVVHPEWIYDGSARILDVERDLCPVLKRRRRPSAILCCSDWVAIGVIRAAKAAGLEVPGDLSVVGYDDIEAASVMIPPLTTVHSPLHEMGACAASLLLNNPDKRHGSAFWGGEVRLRTQLRIRGSSATPATGRPRANERTHILS